MCQQNTTKSGKTNDLYRLLADPYRRATLSYFRNSESDIAEVSDIADSISDDGKEEQVRIRLHHQALPRLDDTEFLDYDARSKTVRYREAPDVESLIESIDTL